MKRSINLIKASLIILIVTSMLVAAVNDWTFIANEAGVLLYSRKVSGHSELQFKSVCLIDQPLEVIGAVLSDIPSYPNWFFKCIESKQILIENTAEFKYYLYAVIDTPWPFSKRDVVYETRILIDYDSEKVVIKSKALTDPLIPLRNGYVRITDSEHQWILEKVSSKKTRISFINRTNAAGPFANYISNSGSRDTTVYSLQNLKSRAHDTPNGSAERK